LGMKSDKREEVRKLRYKGFSYSEIRQFIHVSKSSLSLWLKDIILTEEQIKRLRRKGEVARLLGSKALKDARIKRQKRIISKAISEVKPLNISDLWLVGVMLYWAEGAKQKEYHPSQRVCFSNSDPAMLILFLSWLRRCLCINPEDILLEIYIHETYKRTREELLKYWSNTTELPLGKFNKVYYKKNKVHSYRKNRGEGYHGVLRISVKRSTDLNRQITGWIYGVCERLSISDIIPK
jgi:hypothetical protein